MYNYKDFYKSYSKKNISEIISKESKIKVEQSEVATATTVVKDEAVAPTITQSEVVTATTVVKDEVSAAPSDNIPETISKK
jgi:predicted metal-binding transcription factor (methanogenesis marker protein 9)